MVDVAVVISVVAVAINVVIVVATVVVVVGVVAVVIVVDVVFAVDVVVVVDVDVVFAVVKTSAKTSSLIFRGRWLLTSENFAPLTSSQGYSSDYSGTRLGVCTLS